MKALDKLKSAVSEFADEAKDNGSLFIIAIQGNQAMFSIEGSVSALVAAISNKDNCLGIIGTEGEVENTAMQTIVRFMAAAIENEQTKQTKQNELL